MLLVNTKKRKEKEAALRRRRTGGADGRVEVVAAGEVDAGEGGAEADAVLEVRERRARSVVQQADRRRVVLAECTRVLPTPDTTRRRRRRSRVRQVASM